MSENIKLLSNQKVIWFTGLSGSGKSTLANALKNELEHRGKSAYVIDGDLLRKGLCEDLGFSDADRSENIRRAVALSKILLELDYYVIVALISPFQNDRSLARQRIGSKDFIEVYVSTPLVVCEARDVKLLYKNARMGHVANMTGIDSVYEVPTEPDVIIDTTNRLIQDCVTEIIAAIELRSYLTN